MNSRERERVIAERIEAAVSFALAASNDRNPNCAAQVRGALEDAHEYCIALRCRDYPCPEWRNWSKLR